MQEKIVLKCKKDINANTIVKLDEECSCNQNYECGKCNGTGFVLTENGEKMLTFLKRHFAKHEKLPIVPKSKRTS
jgi:hypothetical protein